MTTVNKVQVPVYRTRRSTLGRKSLPVEEKKELYEFKCDENKTGKRLKKTQKVRKRARIIVRHKETPPVKKILKGLENKENIKTPCHDFMVHKENIAERKILKVLDNKKNINSTCDSSLRHEEISSEKNVYKVLENEYIKTPCQDLVRHKASTPEKKILSSIENKEYIKIPYHNFSPLSPNFSPLLPSPNITFTNHCSTPVRDPYDLHISRRSSSPDVSNCFGFSEEDSPEEFLLSPISFKDGKKTPAPQPIERPVINNPNVKDVIRLLKFDINESEEGEEIFKPLEELSVDVPETSPSTAASPVITHKPKQRRSYERPQYLWKANKSFEDSDDDEEHLNQKKVIPEDNMKKKKVTYKKKKNALSKKEEEELEKWAKAFNSQCDQVAAFDLCIE